MSRLQSEKFFNDCHDLIRIMEDNTDLFYLLDNNVATLSQVMITYEKSMPSNVQRYKGLGEMSRYSIKESTLYPGSDRTLIRYTMEDIKEATTTIREFESDTKKILNFTGVITRDDLLE